jgi:hypothetical protein
MEHGRGERLLRLLWFGHVRAFGAQRLVSPLRRIDLPGEATIDHRKVSLLWYAPFAIDWPPRPYPGDGSKSVETFL